jgi:hypothetical protein
VRTCPPSQQGTCHRSTTLRPCSFGGLFVRQVSNSGVAAFEAPAVAFAANAVLVLGRNADAADRLGPNERQQLAYQGRVEVGAIVPPLTMRAW